MTGIFFDGCAWASAYHLGVIDTINSTETPIAKAGGSSAGAVLAMALMLGVSSKELTATWNELGRAARVHGCVGKMSLYQDAILRMWLPDGGPQYMSLNDRLFVGITTFPFAPRLIHQWPSNANLRDCVHSSMHIPMYATYETERVAIDGAWIQSFWDLPGVSFTIHVSPMDGAAHVTPHGPSVSFVDVIWPAHVEGRLRDLGRKNMADYLQGTRNRRFSVMRLVMPLRYGALLAGWVMFFARRALLAYLRRDRAGVGLVLITWAIWRRHSVLKK